MPEARAFGTICGVAALLGQTGALALLAGVTLPLDKLVDLAFDQHDRRKRQQLRTLCGCLADELDHLVPGDKGRRESVRTEAERLLDRFGPGDRDFVDKYGMNASAVADDFLDELDWSEADRKDLEPALRSVLICFYDRLPHHQTTFEGLFPHIQQAILATTRENSRKLDTLQATVDSLVARERDLAHKLGIQEGMLIEVARRYAEGNPDNFEAALAGVRHALEVTAEEKRRGALPSNLSEAVNAVIARVDELNEQGQIDAGQDTLETEVAALEEESRAGLLRLHEKGITQAILTRNVASAHRHALAMHDLEADLADQPAAHASLLPLFKEWYERGRDKGLNFDLEVAIALAHTVVARSVTSDQRGNSKNDLGIALEALGRRENNTDKLEKAVSAYRDALKERTRQRVPLQWAMTQNNLGSALAILGQRENNADRLEEALAAIRSAREVIVDESGQEHHAAEFDQRIAAIENALAAMRPA